MFSTLFFFICLIILRNYSVVNLFHLSFFLQNDQAYNAILKCKWHLLERKERQMFSILMHNCQKPRKLSVGGFTPLNMVTCVNVSIYSRCGYEVLFILYELTIIAVFRYSKPSTHWQRSSTPLCTSYWWLLMSMRVKWSQVARALDEIENVKFLD